MKPKAVKAPPGARRLIESLRDLGYETKTAIADIVDNSINANSSKVTIEVFSKAGTTPAHIILADNGSGMHSDDLWEAMRFGSHKDYSIDDLGKYGLGLKTASLSQCGLLTVASKPKKTTGKRSRVTINQWDVAHINKTDDWDLLTPDLGDLPQWMRAVINENVSEESKGGTVVIWSNLHEYLPLLESDDQRTSEGQVATLISEISEHLKMVFHRFMDGSVKEAEKLTISVGGNVLIPWDPFCRTEHTKRLSPQTFSIRSASGELKGQKHKVIFQPYILPSQAEFSSRSAHKDASGPRNWNIQQGFYYYRNNRLIQAGGWSNLRGVEEHHKLLRIAIDFNAALDDSFGINITKMKAKIPAEIREEVKNFVTEWIKPAETRYRGKSKDSTGKTSGSENHKFTPARSTGPSSSAVSVGPVSLVPSNARTSSLAITKGSKPGYWKIIVPQNHILSASFNNNGKDAALKQMILMLIGLLESIVMNQIDPKKIPLESIKKQIRKFL